ncbi:MAG: efflux RND transporter permease subunit, partial [Pseudomonadales bacterium]|nr:efflux RND transporter permease subunit [Pseudomonadales bacterium]
LAIGLVVDDAILVVENVQRLMSEEGMTAGDAARHSMMQVRGPVISTTLVLLSVFVPFVFIPGISGELYKQFAVTLSGAVVVSSLVALTLSPALCASLLSPRSPSSAMARVVSGQLLRVRRYYGRGTDWLTRRPLLALLFLLPLAGAAWYLYSERPTGFVPVEDQGTIFLDIKLPDAAALPRTQRVSTRIADVIGDIPEVRDYIIVNGLSMSTGGIASNGAMGIVRLQHWDERRGESQSAFAIAQQLRERLAPMREADINVMMPPSIRGLGRSGGVNGELLALAGQDTQELSAALRALLLKVTGEPGISSAFSSFSAEYPRLFLDVDRNRAEVLGVDVARIFATLQSQFSPSYVDDFNLFGRSYRVYMMADSRYRRDSDDLLNTHVRSDRGAMVPLRAVARLEKTVGPDKIQRFNQYLSAGFNVNAMPGTSTGEVIAGLQRIARTELPEGFRLGWSGLSYEQLKAEGQVVWIFLLSLVFVLLFLVAQYESWTLPLAILLSVVVGMFGAMVGLTIAGLENNIYAQIG